MKQQRGAALLVVLFVALVGSVGVYGVLMTSMGMTRQSIGLSNALRARYAAEAGLVWARQRLWESLQDFGGGTDLTVNGMDVDVTGACSTLPCDLQARVVY